MKQKKINGLIIMNGRWRDNQHIYVAAKSKRDAAEILKQANKTSEVLISGYTKLMFILASDVGEKRWVV